MTRGRRNQKDNSRRLASQQSVNGAIKSICDIMRRSNCAGALQYVPELTWILFLRILDERETREAEEAEAVGAEHTPSLEAPYRWQDWAAPGGPKRTELQNGALGAFFGFVNGDLIPHLKGLREKPNAAPRQKVISEIFSGVERTRIDTERNLLDVLDKVHEISGERVDPTHVFTLSQVYEGLLLKMGERGNDGGQFFTPREIIRVMVKVVDPKIGETVYDPGCGTGGFLAQSFEHMGGPNNANITSPDQLETLKTQTFYGREKDNAIYPIALANLVLHNIDEPHIWHGNSLTGQEIYGGLFSGAPALYDVILMNPPFGGKESKDAQARFAYKTSATQVLFLQHVIDNLKPGGRCGIVLLRPDQAKAPRRVRPLVHPEPPARDVRERRRGREDEPALFHKGEADRADLVLRPLPRQGGQEEPAHARQVRGILPCAARAGGWRAKLDSDAAGDRGEELRPEGGQPQREESAGHAHAGRATGPDRSQGARSS